MSSDSEARFSPSPPPAVLPKPPLPSIDAVPAAQLQVRDLPPGSLGFVQLCYDRQAAQHVAIRFIERGEKVRPRCMS